MPGTEPLVPLPVQPADCPWPTEEWPEGPVPDGVALQPLLDTVCSGQLGQTYAAAVVHRGRLVAERYGGELVHWDRPAEAVGQDTQLLSWSMAKSVLHAAVGVLVASRRLILDQHAAVPSWRGPDDPRRAITLEHLLCMRDGLGWAEDYVDAAVSDVIEMLFGAGQDDVAGFAAERPLAVEPGQRFNYSSGTSNIVSGIVARTIGGGEPYERFLLDQLLHRIGMTSAQPRLDAAGTWVASSYLYATARDWARFGLLYLRDGVWEGERLLPEGWVDHGRLARSEDPEDGRVHGAHWWVVGDQHGSFWASGYEGQSVLVCPGLDLVVVRLGKSTDEQSDALFQWRQDVVTAFSTAGVGRAGS